MTDITDEQRAAVEWLRRTMNIQLEPHAGLLFDLLPFELTNPQPTLPTDPGLYVDSRGVRGAVWRVENNGDMHREGGQDEPLRSLAPFTRLVPERPQITREQVIAVFDSYGDNYDVETVNDLVELANGTDRD